MSMTDYQTQTLADVPGQETEEPQLYGLLSEYRDVTSLKRAAERVRDAGYTRWEAYTPFPVHGLDQAMGHKPTVLPWLVLVAGFTGCLSGLFLVWYTNATNIADMPHGLRGYPFIISGKPIFSLPANIPPIFELTILFSAITAVVGMLVLNLLPRFHHPVFGSERFTRATQDRFFIGIEAADDKFDRERTEQLLRDTSPLSIEELED